MKKEEVKLFNALTGYKYNCTLKDYPIVKEFLYNRDFILSFDIDWYNVSRLQKLSEDFIREFKDEVYWGWISINPKLNLSPEFREEFGI